MNPITTERADGSIAGGGDLALVARALGRAAAELVPGPDVPPVTFESPRNPGFGDFATNVAFALAQRVRRNPKDIAAELAARASALEPELGRLVSALTPLGGFINVTLAPMHWQRSVAAILKAGTGYGRSTSPTGERVSLEFGSANPTGPLVVVQGRTLSLGDTIANAMRFCGIDVETEWIVNDAGSQIDTLGRSLYARYRQITDPAFPFPEDGYPGSYLLPIAHALRERYGAEFDGGSHSEWRTFFARYALDALVAQQRATCVRFGVHFDRWQSERELHERGAVAAAVAELARRGLTFEHEGAVWLRTTAFGDDKDRVLVRSDGRPTYLAPDVAYHYEKLQRTGRAILILGPDHHGYVERLKTIAAAFDRPGAIEVVIAQQMTTIRNGAVVSLSKRAGDVLLLDEVLDEVGVDAARFFFAMTSPDSPLTFDLTLAREQSSDNPVYYVQYAHARIASIERGAPAQLRDHAALGTALDRLVAPAELALIRRLAEFPSVVRAVAEHRAPHRLTRYAQTVAGDFTQFYVASKVLGDDRDLSAARLGLARAAKIVLGNTLRLLGVSAPEAM